MHPSGMGRLGFRSHEERRHQTVFEVSEMIYELNKNDEFEGMNRKVISA